MTRDGAGGETALGLQAARPQPGVIPAGALVAQASAENFPVALRLLPGTYRDRLMAVYAFARTVDDIGDEAPSDQRLALLVSMTEDLERLYADPPGDPPAHPAVRGLAGVVTDCAIPMQPFRDLVAANEQDQVVFRYQTFEDLLGYCELSANPVGRIVLYVFGCHTPERGLLSDAVCSALQVIEHLQDVAEDYRAERVYLPQDDLRRHGCREQDLAAPAASAALRGLVAAEADRAGALLAAGAPLVGQLSGAGRVAVAGYLAGGRAALAALARARYDVLATTPRPSKGRTVASFVRTLVRGR
jgi:squalene synthase HpnC